MVAVLFVSNGDDSDEWDILPLLGEQGVYAETVEGTETLKSLQNVSPFDGFLTLARYHAIVVEQGTYSLELAHRIRALSPVPILYITKEGEVEDVLRALLEAKVDKIVLRGLNKAIVWGLLGLLRVAYSKAASA